MKEESFFQYDFQSLNLDSFYSPHTFHLKNVSSDSHPILRSIRILPRFNPHICYPCLLAVFFSTNLLLAKDVSSFLSRAKELLRSLHLANLSYYTTAQQRCFDDTLICGVIDANVRSVDPSPRDPVDSLHMSSCPVPPLNESSPTSPMRSSIHPAQRSNPSSSASGPNASMYATLQFPSNASNGSTVGSNGSIDSTSTAGSANSHWPHSSHSSHSSHSAHSSHGVHISRFFSHTPSHSSHTARPIRSAASTGRLGGLLSFLPGFQKKSRGIHPSSSDPSLVPPPRFAFETPPSGTTPEVLDAGDAEASPFLRFDHACVQSFQEQVGNSLFNLSRVITLVGLQFFSTLRTDNKEVGSVGGDKAKMLTSVIATVYELPTIISEGDFHIFVNTLFFGNPRYISRYDVSLSPQKASKPRLYVAGYPNMLCRLFTHWSSDVREYIHKLVLFRIILKFVFCESGRFISRNGSFTDTQMELINAYVEASDGGEGEENAVWHHDYNHYDEIVYDYQALGRKIVELLSEYSRLQQRKRRSLPQSVQVGLGRRTEWKSSSFIERLACEVDANLFVALIEQYAEGDCKIREQPVAR